MIYNVFHQQVLLGIVNEKSFSDAENEADAFFGKYVDYMGLNQKRTLQIVPCAVEMWRLQ
jgi:hypothetical protein